MKTNSISEAEFKVIDELAKDKNLTQKEISRRARISVGLVNLALKKLARKGYIKVRALNKRNLQYILTPRGLSALTKRSYRFLRRTLHSLRVIKGQIQTLILEEYQRGERNFLILADEDMASVIELSLQTLRRTRPDIRYRRISSEDEISTDRAVILLATTRAQAEFKHTEIRKLEAEGAGHRIKYIDILNLLTSEPKIKGLSIGP